MTARPTVRVVVVRTFRGQWRRTAGSLDKGVLFIWKSRTVFASDLYVYYMILISPPVNGNPEELLYLYINACDTPDGYCAGSAHSGGGWGVGREGKRRRNR